MGISTAVATAASVAGAGSSIAGTIMSAKGQKAADNFQSAELSERAQIGQAKAAEVSNNIEQRLNLSLGQLDAVRAAAHDDPTSPTAAALRGTLEERSNLEKSIQVGNILSQSEMDSASADFLTQAGSFAMNMGFLKAGGQAAGALASAPWASIGNSIGNAVIPGNWGGSN